MMKKNHQLSLTTKPIQFNNKTYIELIKIQIKNLESCVNKTWINQSV